MAPNSLRSDLRALLYHIATDRAFAASMLRYISRPQRYSKDRAAIYRGLQEVIAPTIPRALGYQELLRNEGAKKGLTL